MLLGPEDKQTKSSLCVVDSKVARVEGTRRVSELVKLRFSAFSQPNAEFPQIGLLHFRQPIAES